MNLKALVIDNGLGSHRGYPSQADLTVDCVTTGPDFHPDLESYDLLIVPNGADHVAMLRIRDQVRAMLDAGKAVFCFCGWFTDWIPGHRWIHDNSHPTREMRHLAGDDPHGLLNGFDLQRLDHNAHGISGWWACGFIDSKHPETALMRDAWGRAVAVADETTTNGFVFATASGPVGDYGKSASWGPLTTLYKNALGRVRARKASLLSLKENR